MGYAPPEWTFRNLKLSFHSAPTLPTVIARLSLRSYLDLASGFVIPFLSVHPSSPRDAYEMCPVRTCSDSPRRVRTSTGSCSNHVARGRTRAQLLCQALLRGRTCSDLTRSFRH